MYVIHIINILAPYCGKKPVNETKKKKKTTLILMETSDRNGHRTCACNYMHI
jgi:hypothetical protein